MALRRKIKEFQERNKRHFLVFWPEEDCYSEVPESKVVGEPGMVGEKIHIKEGTKIHQSVLVAEGSKQVVQQKLEEIESGDLSSGRAIPNTEPARETDDSEESDTKQVRKRKRPAQKKCKGEELKTGGSGKPQRKRQKKEGKILHVMAHDETAPATLAQSPTLPASTAQPPTLPASTLATAQPCSHPALKARRVECTTTSISD